MPVIVHLIFSRNCVRDVADRCPTVFPFTRVVWSISDVT